MCHCSANRGPNRGRDKREDPVVVEKMAVCMIRKVAIWDYASWEASITHGVVGAEVQRIAPPAH